MRQKVIAKIIDIKKSQDFSGFNPKSMRWPAGTAKHPDNRFRVRGVHFSAVDWQDPSISDDELLDALETIIRQASKQM